MAYEKDLKEICEIYFETKKIQERINEFSYQIETDDVTKAVKQVKTLKNTLNRIIDHLSTLTTNEDFKKYLDTEYAIEKVRNALKRNNMIDAVTLDLYHITMEDLILVSEKFGITPVKGMHGSWTWYSFQKDDKHLSNKDLMDIGLILPEIEKPKVEKKEEPKEEIEEEILPFGWLSPTGTFTEGDFGDHEEKAIEIIKKKGFKEEYKEWQKENLGMLARDYLIEVKGYVLLHNPVLGAFGKTIVSHSKQPTKAQCEYLYDYFTKEKDFDQANYYLNLRND